MADVFVPSAFFPDVSGLRTRSFLCAISDFFAQLEFYFLVLRDKQYLTQQFEDRPQFFAPAFFLLHTYLLLRDDLAGAFSNYIDANKNKLLLASTENLFCNGYIFYFARVTPSKDVLRFELFACIEGSSIFATLYAVCLPVRYNAYKASYLLLTSSTARRITSASVMPSFVACLTIHACWEALKTIWRWIPFIGNSFAVANNARLQLYWSFVK